MMMRSIRAGVWYFVIMFAIGWLIGPVRVLFVEPAFGETAALVIEAPVMLAAMVYAVLWLTARMRIPSALLARVLMGLTALAILLAAETASFAWLEGRPLTAYVEKFSGLTGAITIALYAAFAALPLVLGRR